MYLLHLLPCTDHVAVLMGKKSPADDDDSDEMMKQQNPMDLVAQDDSSME
jgi:hypothetical protein